ncbi:MAG: archease [Thermodesulfovibrionales bacterium]|nr:archease [Thermodesulfovibrionales bacterium]
MKPFKILDISGDIGLRSFGKTVQEAFVNAAIGMYSLITDTGKIEEKKSIAISLENDSLDNLLVAWLNELVFHFDAYGFIGKKILITESNLLSVQSTNSTSYQIEAVLSGEDFDPERHESRLLIKAATYHRLRIRKSNDVWKIDIIFDI